MRRREFAQTASLAFGLLGLSRAADARSAGKVHRIALLGSEESPPWQAFRRGLRELGYIQGRNLVIEPRWSRGYSGRMPALAAELVAWEPDIIVASGTPAIRAAMQATETIPIVFPVSAYPDRLGLVRSLAHPGGNATGLSNVFPELMAKKLELLREIAPQVSHIAVILNMGSPVEPLALREFAAAASAAGATIDSIDVRGPDRFDAAFAAIESSRANGLYAIGNQANFNRRRQIAEFARRRRLPAIFDERLFVEAGGLISYAPSFVEMFRRAADFVDKILKGARPGDLPVEQPVKFELLINRNAAAALGLTIPASLLLRADEVIE